MGQRGPTRRAKAAEPDATSLAWQQRQYENAIARLDEAFKTQPPMRPALQVEYTYNMAVIDNGASATLFVSNTGFGVAAPSVEATEIGAEARLQNPGRTGTETAAELLGGVSDDHCQQRQRRCRHDERGHRISMSVIKRSGCESRDNAQAHYDFFFFFHASRIRGSIRR